MTPEESEQDVTHVTGEEPVATPEKGFLSYDFPKVTLPVKEAAVVRLLALGRTAKSIADEFNVSPACIEQRKKRAMNRVGVRTVAGLIHYAIMVELANLGEAE